MARLIQAALLAVLLPLPLAAQTLLSGDHSVDGNLCVGSDCSGSETFGDFDDLKIKSAATGILFDDIAGTSTNDWRLRTNDTNEDSIWIQDVTGGTAPFKIRGTAPDNSLFLAADGSLGLGTSIPQARLHLHTATDAGLRIDRSGLGGPDQAYEMQVTGNGYFNITDVNTNNIPFSIRSGSVPHRAFEIAPFGLVINQNQSSSFNLRYASDDNLSAFYVHGDNGNVGVGTESPAAPLHVWRPFGGAAIVVENSSDTVAAPREMFRMVNNGGSYFTLRDNAANREWYFVHENNPQGRFFINHSDGGLQMALTRTGDMTILGELHTAGSCSAGCDRVFDEDYPLPTIAEQAALMKANKHLPNVGPTPENGPFNLTAMTGGMLNELEKAHLYIGQLHEENAALEARLAAQETENAAQDDRFAAQEAEIADLRALVHALVAAR
ncbi:hypothetical protein [Tropicibacter sp. S64]|uniref:hypothetical protein n=1 Tax=Tropicibacter sp. S64 TaxID=3415122 RepID=UPI003C7A607C